MSYPWPRETGIDGAPPAPGGRRGARGVALAFALAALSSPGAGSVLAQAAAKGDSGIGISASISVPSMGDVTRFAADQLPVRSRLSAAEGELECNVIDFDGVGDNQPVGLVEGSIDVTFGNTWLGLIDSDNGSTFTGNFANEPSPSTIAYFLGSASPISFSEGVQFVQIFYTATAASVPVTLTARSGPNGTGSVVAQVVGNTVGSSVDGAPCIGDPSGAFCLWSTLTLVASDNVIRSITISGATANAFGFDDMTFCNAPPVTFEQGPEESFVPATVRPERPRVIFGPDGGKAVVWFQQGNGGTIICVQFFDANGRALTQPLLANVLPGDNKTPTASFDDQGRLHILWTRDEGSAAFEGGDRLGLAAAQGSSVVGRTFDPGGQPQSGEVTVSSAATGESSEPESDSDLSGNSVVVWQDGGKVRGRLLDSSGNPLSEIFDVNTGNTGADPSLGVSASGDFVVAWEGVNRIFHRRYRDDGVAKAAGELVSDVGSPANPAVGTNDAGDFIVVWDANGPSGRDIFAQRYRANGTKRGGIVQINANAAGDQTLPRVDVNAKGRFAIVWETTEGGTPGGASIQGQSVVGRTFNPQGEPERAEEEIATAEEGTTPEKPDVSVNEDDDFSVVFERRGAGGQSEGIFRKDVDVISPPGVCVADATTLCLSDDRFQVTALWEDPATHVVSSAQAVSLTDDTGYFWFFNADNVEVVTKALAACPINSRFWVFAAGLTNVEVTLRVDDVITGQSNTYFSRREQAFPPILDTDAFQTCTAATAPTTALSDAEVAAVRDEVLAGLLTLLPAGAVERSGSTAADTLSPLPSAGAEAACATDSDTLCVTGNRFTVEVDFETAGGQGGSAQAIKLTNDTGYFTFFSPENVEIVIKVLNACTFSPPRFWVFAAGLTNVEANITVVDTNTGARREYENPLGTSFVPIQDANAFNTCP